MDMTPFNYLVDVASGRVTAILDWEGASQRWNPLVRGAGYEPSV